MIDYQLGNIWDYHKQGWWIVVTTNLGWKTDGANVMGRGIAQEANNKYLGLDISYGQKCQAHNGKPFLATYPKFRLLLLPTKTLHPDKPYMSWKQDSSLELIDKSLNLLRRWIEKQEPPFRIAIPAYPGCGNGRLDRQDVIPILEKHLGNLPGGYGVTVVDKLKQGAKQ
jgi:hypothetical protein